MNKFLSIFAVALCAFAPALAEVELDEGVYVLGDDTFDAFIKENEFVLAEFYAPWCGHCKQLAPEYVKAAASLVEAESSVKLAKVDATVHSEIAQTFDVKGYPTLFWFRSGNKNEYGGGRTADEIVQWVTKKSGSATNLISTVEELEEAKAKNQVVVLGSFASTDDAEYAEFKKVAEEKEVFFAYTLTEAVTTAAGSKSGGVVLFKQFDDLRADFEGELTSDDLLEFVNGNELPWVMEFGADTQKAIFGGAAQEHVLLFADLKSDSFTALKECYTAEAKERLGKLMLITVDSTKSENANVLQYFNIEGDDVNLRIINLSEDMKKFVPAEPTITCDVIKSFIGSYINGELSAHLNSEEIPEDWDKEDVKVLVGKNFHSVAMEEGKTVFVEFYAPWCGHCKSLAPIWERLGLAFKDAANVVIAKMDSTANEVEEVSVQGFPTLKLVNDKNEIIDYEGGREFNDLKAFVEKHSGAVAADVPGGEEEEEDDDEDDDEDEDDDDDDDEHDEL